MSDFKRNSSRFSRGGGDSENGSERSGGGRSFNRGGKREESNNRGGNGGRSGGRGNNGSKGDFPFTRIASLTIPKSASDDMAEYVEQELKGSEIRLNAQVYLGKGDNELTLKTGDMLLVSFKTSDKDKDFVVGNVSVKN